MITKKIFSITFSYHNVFRHEYNNELVLLLQLTLVSMMDFLKDILMHWLFAFPVAIVAAFIMGPIAKIIVSKIASKD